MKDTTQYIGGKKNYNKDFYKNQMNGSYRSAKKYVKCLSKILKPCSVIDVGCGRGMWLKAFKESGTELLYGFDGSWNNQESMVDQSINFIDIDLNQPIPKPDQKYELAMSLEVAEHLKEESAKNFVEGLTSLSDVVMFGAAFTGQGGTDHINEQPHTYWAKIFNDYDYVPYDIFRLVFWGDPDVETWYKQNTFLYVKKNVEFNSVLNRAGFYPLENIAFMDCVHPDLYRHKLSQSSIRVILYKLSLKAIPVALLPFLRKIKTVVTTTSKAFKK